MTPPPWPPPGSAPMPEPPRPGTPRETLPGEWLAALSARFCTTDQHATVVLPAIADLQAECLSAGTRLAFGLAYVRGLAGVWRVLALCLAARGARTVLWLVTSEREDWITFAKALGIVGMVLAMTLLFAIWLFPRHYPMWSTWPAMMWMGLRMPTVRDTRTSASVLLRRAVLVAPIYAVATLLISGWVGPLIVRGWLSPGPVDPAQLTQFSHLTLSDLLLWLDQAGRHQWMRLIPIVLVEIRLRVLLATGVLGMSCLASASMPYTPPQRVQRRLLDLQAMVAGLAVYILGIWLAYSALSTLACVLVMLAADAVAIALAGLMFRRVAEDMRNQPPLPPVDYRPPGPRTILGLARTDS